MKIGAVWTLRQGDVVHGTITITEQDFPWLHGSWEPTVSFGGIAHLFAAELQLSEENLDADGEDWDEWEAAYDAIVAAHIRLHYPNELAVPEFLLHIDNNTAWFRWSDELFEN
jgi:hypothetical protein